MYCNNSRCNMNSQAFILHKLCEVVHFPHVLSPALEKAEDPSLPVVSLCWPQRNLKLTLCNGLQHLRC